MLPPICSSDFECFSLSLSLYSFTLEKYQDIYGITDPEDYDCQVCLSNVKNIVFLPCRHCCVCNQCFEHIDRCPSCRGTISSHLTFVQAEKLRGVEHSREDADDDVDDDVVGRVHGAGLEDPDDHRYGQVSLFGNGNDADDARVRDYGTGPMSMYAVDGQYAAADQDDDESIDLGSDLEVAQSIEALDQSEVPEDIRAWARAVLQAEAVAQAQAARARISQTNSLSAYDLSDRSASLASNAGAPANVHRTIELFRPSSSALDSQASNAAAMALPFVPSRSASSRDLGAASALTAATAIPSTASSRDLGSRVNNRAGLVSGVGTVQPFMPSRMSSPSAPPK